MRWLDFVWFTISIHELLLFFLTGPIGTPREGNATLIIVGIGITVFIFIVVIFIFLVVFYKMFSKRRASATTLVGSYTMSTMMEGDQSPAEVRQPFEVAAVNDVSVVLRERREKFVTFLLFITVV